MDFILKLPLEHIALVKVAAILWNQNDIRTLVTEFSNSQLFSKLDSNLLFMPYIPGKRKEKWLSIEDQVIRKVPQLIIPACLEENILCYIQTVGLEILRWVEYHRKCCCLNLNLPSEFCWTPRGTVDKKKTAELIIKDESIDIITRYKLACIYCLEDDIFELWKDIPEIQKISFYDEENIESSLQMELLVFWGYYMKGEMTRMGNIIRRRLNRKCSAYRYMFRCVAESGNIAATEFFLKKINPKRKSLMKTASYIAKIRQDSQLELSDPPNEYFSEVLCFLLSQMNSRDQLKVFRNSSFKVVLSLLDWPFQSFFLQTICHVLDFLSGNRYIFLLLTMTHKVIFGYKDFNYRKLFGELWQKIPHVQKDHILNDDTIAGLLYLMLQIKDKRNIKLIFQDTTLVEKNKLISSDGGRALFERLICNDDWDLLKFLVQMCISSNDQMLKFKKEYQDYLLSREAEHKKRIVSHGYQFDEFFRRLDEFVHGHDKRKSVENESSPAKRHCICELMMTNNLK